MASGECPFHRGFLHQRPASNNINPMEKSTAMTETAAHRQPRKRGPGRPFPKGMSGNPRGRPAGSVAKVHEMIQKAGGTSPLQFLLNLINDSTAAMSLRLDAARLALPYT